jgi:predicted transposase YbfD/YdcC
MGLDRCLLKPTDSALSLLRVSTSAVKAKIGKSAEFITKTIRSHWHVENKLHWQLDISFNEYYNRLRSGNTADNFALMKKIAKINGV